MDVGTVCTEGELQRELTRVAHNSGAKRIREAMAEAGWVNPDGHGVIYYHPDICGAKGDPIEMLSGAAIEIQGRWEEFGKPGAVKQ